MSTRIALKIKNLTINIKKLLTKIKCDAKIMPSSEQEDRKMNEEVTKLAKVKKSCRAGRIITKVLMIIGIVAVSLSLIGGISIMAMGDRFDSAVISAGSDTELNESVSVSSFPGGNGVVLRIEDTDDIEAIKGNLTITSLAENFGEGLTLHTMFGLYLFFICAMCIGMTLIMYFLTSTFAIIEKEESPFSKRVIKRLTAVFIVVSVVMLLTLGWGAALIMGVTTWALYTIFDYGRILQIQADETL